MKSYKDEVHQLLSFIGGKENIQAVTHCMTRMRFVLMDEAKADIKNIETISIVKGSFTQSGQFQIIIGNEVAEFYKEFISIANIEGVSKDEVKQQAKKNQNIIQRMVSVLAEIFAPLIPAIITGGLILGFRNCLEGIYFFENGTKTICDISQFWSGINHFLWLIGEAIFHMLPVGICWSVTKKMGTTQIFGIILGLTLVSGQLLNAYAVGSTVAENIPVWNFGFFKINMIGYQAQVIPAILAAFTLVHIEKFFKKITPQVVSVIVVPFCSILLSVMAAHFILGPIGWAIGSAISSVVYAGITGSLKIVFGAIFGFIYAPLVITGLHHMSNAIDLQLIADYGGTMLWPMIALSNIAQGSAVMGMIALQRKNTKAQEINIPAALSCYLGVTEPAIFGVNLKYAFPFLCGMIGSSLAAIVCVMTQTTAQAIGIGGLPGILSIKPQYMLNFALCILIAVGIPFILTYFIGKKKLIDRSIEVVEVPQKEMSIETETETELKAFTSGKVIPLSEVPDDVFASGCLGDGLAIIPTEGIIYAPADAIIENLTETKHACSLKLSNDMELLIHVGIDTVKMNGAGFEYLVEEGQQVKAGTEIMKFDIQKIKGAGYSDIVVCIIVEAGNTSDIKLHSGIDAIANIDKIMDFAKGA